MVNLPVVDIVSVVDTLTINFIKSEFERINAFVIRDVYKEL